MTVRKKKTGARKRAAGAGSVAITGAAGTIGSRLLARLLESDAERAVVVADIQKPALEDKRIRFHRVDLTEPAADATLAGILKKEHCETLVHAAFLTNPARNHAYAHELQVIGTMHVLHAAGEAKVRKLVVAGTTMSYGAHHSNPNFLTEEHPLRANPRAPSLADRVESEGEVARFARKNAGILVTVLRCCWLMGPTVNNFVTTFFSRSAVPTLLGYDPLLQFVHEDDAIEAFARAVEHNFAGAYNIVGNGVLPLSTLLKLGGKVQVPVFHVAAYPLAEALWMAQLSEAPAPYLDYLRFLWVADGDKARIEMGFEPKYSTKEAWMSFVGSRRLRKYQNR
ncbi:MAG: NAD-dependent epimerase/dehydratase family protein [Myxococcota bacterium]